VTSKNAARGLNRLRAALFLGFFLPVAASCAWGAAAGVDRARLVRAVMNEAEGEPYVSKLAHAYVFVNRRRAGMTWGSSGLDSDSVRARLARAPRRAWDEAGRAADAALNGHESDPTDGAVFCENVEAFDVPGFILRMGDEVEKTADIRGVVFWRKR